MKRLIKFLPLLFEIILLVLALSWVQIQAAKLQNSSSDGVARWQQDLVSSRVIELSEPPRLISLWCQRDSAVLTNNEYAGFLNLCPGRVWSRIESWLAGSGHHQISTETEARWRQELIEQSIRWRSLLAQSSFESNSNGVNHSSEPEIFEQEDNRQLREKQKIAEALAVWDAWHSEHSASTSAELSVLKADALWRMATMLDGNGNEEPAKLIRQFRKRIELSDKATRSISLVSDLTLWLAAHWMVTVLGMVIVRSSLTQWDQLQLLILLCMGCLSLLHFSRLLHIPKSYAVLMAGCMLLTGCIWLIKLIAKPRAVQQAVQFPSLTLLLPGWWLFTAIGWLLLMDESLNFHPRLRFLALDQWWNWCLASLLLPLAVVLSPVTLSLLQSLTRLLWRRAAGIYQAWRWVIAIVVLMGFAFAHRSGIPAHVSGEAMKLVFVFSAAGWCVWKMPLASQLWHEAHVRQAVPRLTGMFSLVVLTAVIAGLTSDKGPWLVIAIAGVMLMASVMGWTTGFGLLLSGFLCIFLLGEQLDVVADRLQAWRNAFTANHDDMARLLWFQHEASLQNNGWGIGETPWCAGVRVDQCLGLPLQLQSDYTFTALAGWWGPKGAWILLTMFSLYVYTWLMQAARQSHKFLQPEKLLQPVYVGHALSAQMFFLTGLLVLVQTWITVCGNLGWLPLTGITWPLISYGKTSLWVTTFLIGTWGVRGTYA